FTKEGKQNVLREKDIAKIVDTYEKRHEEKGYSHLATREEIIENEYNLNIPRYIDSIDEEIPDDVDAHLYGGIPYHNIRDLHVLQDTVPHVMEDFIEEIRTGYVTLTKSMDELTNDVLNDSKVIEKSKAVEEKLVAYQNKYWELLKSVDDVNKIRDIRESMLAEIKDILLSFDHMNEYDGYQIIADIWENKLTEDTEVIALSDFYTEGRTRVPLIVTKGTGRNRREEQDGWVGNLIPNDLIKSKLFKEELTEIETKETRRQEVEAELDELVEAAKVEESD